MGVDLVEATRAGLVLQVYMPTTAKLIEDLVDELRSAREQLADCQKAFDDAMFEDVMKYKAQLATAREALEWYADEVTIAYQMRPNADGTFRKDNGDRARAALKRMESSDKP